MSPSATAENAVGVRYTVMFTAASALSAGTDTITLAGPTGTSFAAGATNYNVKDASGSLTNASTVVTGTASVTITTPVNVTGGDTVEVVAYGVTNGTASGNFSVSTSKDTATSVGLALVAAQAPQSVVISPSSTAVGVSGVRDTITFKPSASGGLSAYNSVGNADVGASTVTINGPTGTVFSSNPTNYWLQDTNGTGSKENVVGGLSNPSSVVLSNSNATVTLAVPIGLATNDLILSGDSVTVSAFGVTNGSTVGGTTTFSTSADTVPSTGGGTLVAAQAPQNVVITPSSTAVGVSGVRDTITFKPSASGGLSAYNSVGNADVGASTVTINGPTGTVFSSNPTNYWLQDTGAGGTGSKVNVFSGSESNPSAVVLSNSNATVTLAVPIGVATNDLILSGDSVTVSAFGVTNGSSLGGTTTFSTSADTVPSAGGGTLVAAQAPQNVVITPSSTAVGATGVRDTITFKPSSSGGLSAYNSVGNADVGASTVTINGPTGTVFPSNPINYWIQDTGAGGTGTKANVVGGLSSPSSVVLSNSNATVTLAVPIGVATNDLILSGDSVTVSAFGVTNGSTVGGTTTFSTSADTVASAGGGTLVAAQAPQNVVITPSSTAVGATGVRDTITFKPSSSGGLSAYNSVGNADVGASTVTINGPTGTVFPSNPINYWLQDTGAGGTGTKANVVGGLSNPSSVVLSNSDATVTLAVPIGVATNDLILSGDSVTVSAFGVTNGSTVGGTTTFSTSADTVASAGGGALVAMQSVTNGATTVTSSMGGATGVQYGVTFTTSSSGGLSGDNAVGNAEVGSSTITIAAPAGTVFPSDATKYTVQDVTSGSPASALCAGCTAAPPLTVTNSGATVTIGVPDGVTPTSLITSGDVVKVVISNVTNPSTLGSITVSTSSDSSGAAPITLPTTTALMSSGSPSTVGQMVTYTATVSPVPDGGTMDFLDGGVTISGCGSVSVNTSTGKATCTQTYNATASHTITSVYSGDASFSGSGGGPLVQVVNGAATTTMVTPSVNPSVVGQTVTYTATVAPVPDGGTMAFKDAGTTIPGCGSVAVNTTTGVATCMVTYNAAGAHSITGTYSGDANFDTSTSSPAVNQMVDKAATTTSLPVSGTNPSLVGQNVMLSTTVSVTAPGAGSPTGTVSFAANGVTIPGCGAQPLSSGSATCTTPFAAAMTFLVTATYSGDSNFSASPASPALSQVVDKANTSTVVTSSVNPSVVGQGVTYTATISVTAPGAGSPSGTVDFTDNGTTITGCGSQPVSTVTETATCDPAYPAPGSHPIVATYGGDTNFNASPPSPTLTQVVTKAATSTGLQSSSNPSAVGQEVTYTATITVTAPGAGSPSGTVDFTDNGTSIAGCGAQPVSTVTETASCDPAYGAVGNHPIVATYGGDSNFTMSVSTALNQAVVPAATTTAVSVAPASVASGDLVTYSATVTSGTGTPGGMVTFTIGNATMCSAALSAGSGTCTGTTAPVGSDTVTGTYSGDATHAVSAGMAKLTVTGVCRVLPGSGYWEVGKDGGVYAFGGAPFLGSLPGLGVQVEDIVGIAPTADDCGYWLVAKDGGVFAFGDAPYLGSLPGLGVHVENIVGMTPTPDGDGYWMVGADGGMFAFGDARYHGSLPDAGIHVENIVAMAAPDAGGYWLVGKDGGVYAFGDAPYLGSLPGLGIHLENVVGMATADAGGYWLSAADGGMYSFGDAAYHGSLPGIGVHVENVVGMARRGAGGYWLAGADGGVFNFGDAAFDGSVPGAGVQTENIVAISSD